MHNGKKHWEPNWLALAGAFALTTFILCVPVVILILCVKYT